MPILHTLADLNAVLLAGIETTAQYRPTIAAIFQMQYNTGLRLSEALEVDKWQAGKDGLLQVQLSKGEALRTIDPALIPDAIRARYELQRPYMMETQAAVNHVFKQNMPPIFFNGNTRRTTTHAFRYRYAKELAAQGKTLDEVAAIMLHGNKANTAGYINDEIKIYVPEPL